MDAAVDVATAVAVIGVFEAPLPFTAPPMITRPRMALGMITRFVL